jgi:polysaccharide export outer membrane protein
MKRRKEGTTILGKVILVMLVALACPVAMSQSPDGAVQPSYQLSSGDRLRIVVFGHEDLSGEFQVDPEGRISMPLIGDLQAAGRSLDQFEDEIVGLLQPDYLKNPDVSAELVSYRPLYIIGEVNSPGSYPFESGMTVINAVAVAGGFTYRARKSRIVITRNVNGEQTKLSAEEGTILLPGDVIEVPERFF